MSNYLPRRAYAALLLGTVYGLGQAHAAPPGNVVRTVPLGPIRPIMPGRALNGGAFMRPLPIGSSLSPLVQVQVSHLPDEGSANFYSIAREGGFSINNPITLAVFTRIEPTFQSFVLQFIDDADQPGIVSCQPLAPPTGLITSSAVGFQPGQVEPRLVTAYTNANLTPKGSGQLRMLSVTSAVPEAIKQRLAAGKTKALLRLVPVGGSTNACLMAPSGTFLATFYDPAKAKPVSFPTPPAPPPAIHASAAIVSYTPEVMPSFQRCDFIVSGPVNNAKFGAIMDAAHASKTIGTHFFLCPDEAQSLYNGLPASTKAAIAFKDFLSFFSNAFNWTADKFQAAAKAIGTPILGEKYGTIFGEAMLGQLPGSPLTGDFNTLVDQGCDYVKNKADAKINDNVKSGESSEVTKPTNSAADQVCAEIKKALAGQDKVNDFLVHMPQYDPRNASVLLRFTYYGTGSPPASMVGGGGDQQVTITSTGAGGSNCVGNACGGPRNPLYQGQFTLPDMPVGSTFTVPVVLSRQAYLQSSDFQSGFVENQKGYLKADYSGTQPILIYLKQPYPIPGNVPVPTP